jgi:DNA polymerase-3 subunit alpha
VGFVHLHTHSEYSLSSSLLKLEDMVRRVAEMKMPAVALTDWGNLYGALHFWKAAKEHPGLKPIYGMELGVVLPDFGSQLRHVVLLASDSVGWQTLMRLSSMAHAEYGLDGELLRPHVPLDRLIENSQGLFCLTAGLKGILNSLYLQNQESAALQVLEKLRSAFDERLFLELQDTGLSPQLECNRWLRDLAAKNGLGCVASSDVHYASPEDAFAHEVWMMVSQKMTLEQNPPSPHTSKSFCLKSEEEIREAFSDFPEAVDNTVWIADRCNHKFSFKDAAGKRIYHLPDFSQAGTDQNQVFREAAVEGLKQRLQERAQDQKIWNEYQARLEFEVQTIIQMGFAGYYLIVSDFIRWAKSHNIPVGPGRGSGAGSLVAYVLDITDLDPIEHGLLFERFLNPERVSLPDFDVDFCQQRRHEVIDYVSKKYGQDRVSQIVTFAKEQSKNALKDVGRVLGLSFAETNRLTKFIPSVQMKPMTLEQSLEAVSEFRDLVATDPKVRQTVELAKRLEGALRQPGVHAAGVIISSAPIAEVAPVSRELGGGLITQWDMKMSEEAGLVKFDFLGLVTLDLMDLACEWIRKRPEPEAEALRYNTIPVHDPRAFELISKGDTLGVFQLESGGMQSLCTRLKPDRFADIAAINALFRPGPLESGMVDDFINRKHGRAKVEVMFPDMEPILRETYGVILYQEQVQEIAKELAGYTLGGADLLRRAMGKKNVKEMLEQRSAFVEGCVRGGKDATRAGELFDLIEKFAGYGFNKSHAAAYAMLAVQTAFLKAVYPTEFFTALLTIEKEDTERLARYIADARARGLEILAPDVNESELNFSIVGPKKIRFGLSAIKNVGEGAVESILEARRAGGAFGDLFDFTKRVDPRKINKRQLESLIQAGAFDSAAEREQISRTQLRGRYLASVERALEWANREIDELAAGQTSLFQIHQAQESAKNKPDYKRPEKELSEREILSWERELLGIYLSGSPLDRFKDRAQAAGARALFELKEVAAGTEVTVAVTVAELREVRVKKGRRAGEMMGIAKVEDSTASMELVSFPDHYKEFQALLKSDKPLIVRAELDFEEEKPKLLCGQVSRSSKLSVEDLSEVEVRWPKKLRVDLNLSKIEGSVSSNLALEELQKLLSRYPGTVPVDLVLTRMGQFQTTLSLGSRFGVRPVQELYRDADRMLAIPGSVRMTPIHNG